SSSHGSRFFSTATLWVLRTPSGGSPDLSRRKTGATEWAIAITLDERPLPNCGSARPENRGAPHAGYLECAERSFRRSSGGFGSCDAPLHGSSRPCCRPKGRGRTRGHYLAFLNHGGTRGPMLRPQY